MQTASSGDWTLITDSIIEDGNHYVVNYYVLLDKTFLRRTNSCKTIPLDVFKLLILLKTCGPSFKEIYMSRENNSQKIFIVGNKNSSK